MPLTKDRLNILVSRPQHFSFDEGRQRGYGPCITVRYSYSDVPGDLWPTDNPPLGQGFDKTGERFDANERNSLGQMGAYVNVYPVDEMRAFIVELRKVWGDLHVQDNSGLLPDLDQGAW